MFFKKVHRILSLLFLLFYVLFLFFLHLSFRPFRIGNLSSLSVEPKLIIKYIYFTTCWTLLDHSSKTKEPREVCSHLFELSRIRFR